MVKQVSFNDLGKVDLVPQAVVHSPLTYFSDRLGFKFEKATDDLDEYESAFFKLDDRLVFALVHYRGNPEDKMTIYFERETKQDAVPSIVEHILHELNLPPSALVWISSK